MWDLMEEAVKVSSWPREEDNLDEADNELEVAVGKARDDWGKTWPPKMRESTVHFL